MFTYKDNVLVLKQGDCFIPLRDIVKGKTDPFYLYDIQGIREWYQFFKQATNKQLKVFFAMKSNFNKEVLKTFLEEGAGVDVVSGGEAGKAQEVGFPPQKIVFSGVGKSTEELESAVEQQFFQINAESRAELERLAQICQQKNKTANLGLRINPNIDFKAHPYIKTGRSGDKFGFEEEEIPKLLKFIKSQKKMHLKGLSIHIGSQIFDLAPLLQAIKHLKKLYHEIKTDFPSLQVMDIGGGLGVNYQKSHFEEEKERVKDFGQNLKQIFKGFEGQAITEPGRLLIARFGILCARIEYIKRSPKKQFIILNSGMNHFLRPALYAAKHRILPFKKAPKTSLYDVVGPICETGDTLAIDYPLPELKSGDWLAVADTGAYGFVMANSYNLQAEVTEISFDRGKICSV